MDYMRWVDRNWPLLSRLMKGHAIVYRATHGLVGHRFPGAPPMLLLDHVGARSGKRRTTPLIYTRDPPSRGAGGGNVVLVASKGGHPKNPAWFHNLMANPDTTIQIGSKRLAVHARIADPEEHKRLWPKVVEVYGGYAVYQRRTEREIPVVVLEPR
jgi:deazaflavin-dependent oxidoreductase (nitroreductase family)